MANFSNLSSLGDHLDKDDARLQQTEVRVSLLACLCCQKQQPRVFPRTDSQVPSVCCGDVMGDLLTAVCLLIGGEIGAES